MYYIWIGCLLPEEFQKDLRWLCGEYNRELGLSTVAFDMPQHISLKISFQVEPERAEPVTEYLTQRLSRESPFWVRLGRVEQLQNILWLPVEENPVLGRLHDMLDRELWERFGIPQHEFDKCYRFHSTLYMDDNVEKVSQMADFLKDYIPEGPLKVEAFLTDITLDGTVDTLVKSTRIPMAGNFLEDTSHF